METVIQMTAADMPLIRQDSQGREYVRITFTPHGGRQRTAWAVKVAGRKRLVYRVVRADGEPTQELVIAMPHEVREEPAGMSRLYAELEVVL